MNPGKKFETNLQEAMKLSCFYYRLRDSSAAWGGKDGSAARFTTTNECDFIAHHNGRLFMIEAKSTDLKSLPYANIKKSQIEGFKKRLSNPYPNIFPIFMVEFRAVNETYAIHAKYILAHMERGERKSVEMEYFREYGILMNLLPKRKRLLNITEAFTSISEKESPN